MRRLLDLALKHKIMLHIHSGAEPIRRLAAVEPKVQIFWAHAGLTEPVSVVADLLAEDTDLLTEVSFRAANIMAGDALDPAWEQILIEHHKRIMIGSDTYVPMRWDEYPGIINGHRRWLALLPEDVRRAIAYENAERIFGAGS
jgi:predicted TIM-barrel fold metal-dependent hydrolase